MFSLNVGAHYYYFYGHQMKELGYITGHAYEKSVSLTPEVLHTVVGCSHRSGWNAAMKLGRKGAVSCLPLQMSVFTECKVVDFTGNI